MKENATFFGARLGAGPRRHSVRPRAGASGLNYATPLQI